MNDNLGPSFEAFVASAKHLLELSAAGATAKEIAEFKEFACAAEHVLYGDIIRYASWLGDAIAPLEASLEAYDVLAVAGITGDENRYTELLAWALWPPGEPQLAFECQRALLTTATGYQPMEPVQPRTQFWTEDGIPDLVLPYPGHPVIVEVKTGSQEHDTPSGRKQTIAYPAAVLRALGLATDGESEMLFLTLDRAAPANGRAHAVSFLETVLAIAKVVEGRRTTPELLAAYRTILRHLAFNAVPPDLDMSDVLHAIRLWRASSPDERGPAIVPFAAALAKCERLLPSRRR